MTRWILMALLLTATSAHALTVAEYVARLERIDALLATNQLAAAKEEARALRGATVRWTRGTFQADASLLGAIAGAARAEGPHRARLLTAIAELRRATGMEAARADRKLLERIAAEQEPPELPEGGAIPTTIEREIPLFERVARAMADMVEWIREQLRKLIEWLLDLLPRRRNESRASYALRWTVFILVALIVVLVIVLAVKVLRRSAPAAPEVEASSAPIGSRADEDPLSRGASEWERYAAQLAAAGRFRESIRAWYHAVLVTCYAAGILHFRKGRTNWEYVASLGPSVEWRPEMIELTRGFEREWYGSLHSTADAHDECSARARSILRAVRGGA